MEYQEILLIDYYLDLQDKSGAYVVLCPDGERQWFVNNIFHRTDGPAVEWNNGDKEYWLHGKHFKSIEEWELVKLKDQII